MRALRSLSTRLAGVGVVGVLASTLVLVDPATAAAASFIDINEYKIGLPSSVVGSLDEATPAQRATAISKARGPVTGWKVPVSTAFKASKTGTTMLYSTAFLGGFEGTNAVLRWAGVDNVGLEALLSPRDAVDPAYVVNNDALDLAGGNGWEGYRAPVAVIPWTQSTSDGQRSGTRVVTWNPVGDLTGGTLTTTVVGAPSGSGVSQDSMGFQWLGRAMDRYGNLVARGSMGGAVTALNSTVMAFGAPSGGTFYDIRLALGANGATVGDGVSDQYRWFPVGHPERPTDAEGNPARHWRASWTCSNGSGGSKNSASFFESDAQWPAFPEPSCAAGTLSSVDIWQVTPGGYLEDVLVHRWTPNQSLIDWQTNYPECADGSCKLELYRVDPTAGGLLSCFNNPELCTNWLRDPAKADNFQCQYGGKVVGLDECLVYGPTFNVATNTPVETDDGVKHKPDTIKPVGDPANGDPVPDTPTNQPNPPVDGPPRDDSCPPPFTWTSLVNPWYYYKATVCGLQDTFIPKTNLITALNPTMELAKTKAPISWVTQGRAALFPTAVGGAGTCPDWSVSVGTYEANIVCDSSYVQAIVAGRPVFAALMIGAAAAPFLRSLWYAAIPVLRPVPTSGGS